MEFQSKAERKVSNKFSILILIRHKSQIYISMDTDELKSILGEGARESTDRHLVLIKGGPQIQALGIIGGLPEAVIVQQNPGKQHK